MPHEYSSKSNNLSAYSQSYLDTVAHELNEPLANDGVAHTS
ncbi:hypothetical protein FHX42_000793 [Saccharopolyspora lacisalsi]|uniref:Uncharacterized protein n=1 Tax=Halosaccharopolyspora lacisalsi TaxID=1000566 RepID=A0A839DPP1_9PSEU|nr:hypothetical protein [Halosaccharopolyspora lacisalsi]